MATLAVGTCQRGYERISEYEFKYTFHWMARHCLLLHEGISVPLQKQKDSLFLNHILHCTRVQRRHLNEKWREESFFP